MTDNQLLEAWVAQRSDPAFSELVGRYVDLVHSAALRQVGDPPLADDVAQAVFLLLASKAASLRRTAALGGWLYRTTRFIAISSMRSDARRRRREQEAAVMHPTSHAFDSEDSAWTQVAPLLDEAMAALPEFDRNALLLRFFQAKPMDAVAEHLGVSEEAAKKRVSRAVDRLRAFFARRGVTLSAAVLTGAVAHNAVQAAPASLVAKIAAAQAGSVVSGGAAALAAAALRQMLWLKLRLMLGCGAAAVATLVLLKLLAPGPAPGEAPQTAAAPAGSVSPAPFAETDPGGKGTATPSTTARPAGKVFFLHIRAAADNQPVANAAVILHCFGVLEGATFHSNTNGLCEVPVPTAEFDLFRVWVSADGFVPKVMDWKPYELQDPVTSYVLKLDRGLTLAGVVQDEQGAPVPGVNIRFTGPGVSLDQRESVALYSSASETRTDAAGRFMSRQMPAGANGGIGVVVSHPDYAAQWLHAALPESLETNWVVVLTRGLPLSGRVASAQGGPVSGATIRVPEPHGGVEVSAKSDDQGRFTLVHLPAGVAELQVRATGFAELRRSVLVESNAPPVLLELPPPPTNVLAGPGRNPVRLSGTVVDANSGAGIPRFEVLLIKVQQLNHGTSNPYPPQRLAEGREGAFDWTDPLTYVWAYMLEVDAEGYEPQQSSLRQHDDGDQVFEFRLQKGGLLAGRVLQPDGRPAVGATLGLANDRYGLELQLPARLDSRGGRWTEAQTDSQGAFALKTMIGAVAIVVVHESGCALLPVLANTNPVVQLEAWGSIEGTVYVGSSPAAGQTVDVGFESTAYAWDQPRIRFQFTTKSDSDGRFRFGRVPPGNHMVFRYLNSHEGKQGPVGFSHGQAVTVRPGETAQITVGGKGRPVIGRFVLSPALTNYDWRSNWVNLVQDKPELAPPQITQFSNYNAFARAYGVYDASIAKYYLDFQPDGAFRVDDVLPGQYTLALSITAPPADPLAEDAWTRPGPVLGATNKTVVVPPMSGEREDEPLDLGTITIPIVHASVEPDPPIKR